MLLEKAFRETIRPKKPAVKKAAKVGKPVSPEQRYEATLRAYKKTAKEITDRLNALPARTRKSAKFSFNIVSNWTGEPVPVPYGTDYLEYFDLSFLAAKPNEEPKEFIHYRVDDTFGPCAFEKRSLDQQSKTNVAVYLTGTQLSDVEKRIGINAALAVK